DSWEWNPALGVWNQLTGAASAPAGTRRHQGAFDSARQRLVVFGGLLPGGVLACNTWEWSGPDSVTVNQAPAAVNGCIGGTLQFTVGAGGEPPLTYQWRRNGVALVNGTQPTDAVVSGAGTATLLISNCTTVEAGAYDCVVSNSCGSVISPAAAASLCPADFNCDGALDSDDVIAFFSRWDSALPQGDVNADGAVDSDDVVDFFAIWDNQGC
ncbi:MAG: immunoglobulin domain-containing protein, partial [Phycisphaerales bacterium]